MGEAGVESMAGEAVVGQRVDEMGSGGSSEGRIQAQEGQTEGLEEVAVGVGVSAQFSLGLGTVL